MNSYYETVNSSSSKENGYHQQTVISRQENLPPHQPGVLNNTSPAMVAQALSGRRMTMRMRMMMMMTMRMIMADLYHSDRMI